MSMLQSAAASGQRELVLDATMVPAGGGTLNYRVGVSVRPETGELGLTDERLGRADARTRPSIGRIEAENGARIRVRRKKLQSHPYDEPVVG